MRKIFFYSFAFIAVFSYHLFALDGNNTDIKIKSSNTVLNVKVISVNNRNLDVEQTSKDGHEKLSLMYAIISKITTDDTSLVAKLRSKVSGLIININNNRIDIDFSKAKIINDFERNENNSFAENYYFFTEVRSSISEYLGFKLQAVPSFCNSLIMQIGFNYGFYKSKYYNSINAYSVGIGTFTENNLGRLSAMYIFSDKYYNKELLDEDIVLESKQYTTHSLAVEFQNQIIESEFFNGDILYSFGVIATLNNVNVEGNTHSVGVYGGLGIRFNSNKLSR